MNSTVTSLPLGPSAPSPVGDRPSLRQWCERVALRVWRALEASGQARAQRHLLEFADRCAAYQPELAKELRAACRAGDAA